MIGTWENFLWWNCYRFCCEWFYKDVSNYQAHQTLFRYTSKILWAQFQPHNKENIAIKKVKWTFLFLSTYKSYVYIILWSIKCVIALCLRKQCIYLNLKILYLLKNAKYHWSFSDWYIIFLLVESLSQCWWLQSDHGGWRSEWLWQFL